MVFIDFNCKPTLYYILIFLLLCIWIGLFIKKGKGETTWVKLKTKESWHVHSDSYWQIMWLASINLSFCLDLCYKVHCSCSWTNPAVRARESQKHWSFELNTDRLIRIFLVLFFIFSVSCDLISDQCFGTHDAREKSSIDSSVQYQAFAVFKQPLCVLYVLCTVFNVTSNPAALNKMNCLVSILIVFLQYAKYHLKFSKVQ